MNEYLKATIMASTFTAVIRLAKISLEMKPGEMSQADFERRIAAEIVAQATKIAKLDDSALEFVRDVLVK